MLTIKPEKRFSEEERVKFFFHQAPIHDIAEFCEKYGYRVVINSPTNYYMQREYGR